MNDYGLTAEEIEIINGIENEETLVVENVELPKRARRFLDRDRKLNEARVVLNAMFPFGWGKRTTGHWADNLAKCSCHMCCNPRRNKMIKKKERLTRQEIIENLRFKEMLDEVA